MKGDHYQGLEHAPGFDAHHKGAGSSSERYVSGRDAAFHATVLALLALSVVGGLIFLLPGGLGAQWPGELGELDLLLIAAFAGGIGASVHALTALAAYIGNRQLIASWLPWIYLRISIGALLALVVYFGLRAGVIGQGGNTVPNDVYIVLFTCALSGMFSKQVTDKLSDLIDNVLVPSKAPSRSDPLDKSAEAEHDKRGATETRVTKQELIQQVQLGLVNLGFLSKFSGQDKLSADGILGDTTRQAIDEFLTSIDLGDLSPEELLGDENSYDYWPNLLDLIDHSLGSREAVQRDHPVNQA